MMLIQTGEFFVYNIPFYWRVMFVYSSNIQSFSFYTSFFRYRIIMICSKANIHACGVVIFCKSPFSYKISDKNNIDSGSFNLIISLIMLFIINIFNHIMIP
eukprot:546283_1